MKLHSPSLTAARGPYADPRLWADARGHDGCVR